MTAVDSTRAAVGSRSRGPLYRLHVWEMTRNKSYFVFVLIFPFGMMFMFLAMNLLLEGEGEGPDFGSIVVPLAVYLAVTGVALTLTAGPIAGYREHGTLRVLGATPVSRSEFIGTHLLVRAVTAFVLSAVVIVVGAGLGLVPWDSIVRLIPAVLGGLAVFLGLGYLLGGVVGSGQLATNLATMIQVTGLFLSGASVPYSIMPDGVVQVLSWVPTSLLTDLVFWATGNSAQVHPWFATFALSLLAGVVLVGLAVRTFRWDNGPR